MIYRLFMKRVLDFLVAVILLVILFIPMCIVGLLIKITSKGPVFFIQERYGRNSLPFKLYKFRSMVDAAPEISNSNFSSIQNYITPFGMFIRKTSIDELPQLWNIIKGNMSFIGPRPLAITDDKVLRLRKINGADSVFPGISGLAQVNGRNNITDEEKALYDAKYAAKLSFHLDMILVFETIVSVIGRKGVFNDNVIDSKKRDKGME